MDDKSRRMGLELKEEREKYMLPSNKQSSNLPRGSLSLLIVIIMKL